MNMTIPGPVRIPISAEYRRVIAKQIAGLHAASWKRAYRGLFSADYLARDVDSERLQYWQKRIDALATGSGEIFLATVARKPAGFLCIDGDTDPAWGAFIDNLHVLPPWQGRGIGGELLAHAVDWARARDFQQLYLWVFARNHTARNFYGRAGWLEAERQVHDIPGGGCLQALRMIRPV